MHPDVDPAEASKTNPLVTEGASAGEPSSSVTTQTVSPEERDKLNAAVKQAVDDMFTVSNAWQPREVVKFVVNCPSGQKALAKHLDVLDLAAADLVEDMDIFIRKLMPSGFDAQGNPIDKSDEESFWKAITDIEKRLKFLDMTNRLIVTACVKPKIVNDGVAIRTTEDGEREIVFGYQVKDIDEQLKLFGKPVPPLKDPEREAYAGTINFNDRMAFFTELQKPLGLIEPFREGQATVLADMESGEGVGVQAE